MKQEVRSQTGRNRHVNELNLQELTQEDETETAERTNIKTKLQQELQA